MQWVGWAQQQRFLKSKFRSKVIIFTAEATKMKSPLAAKKLNNDGRSEPGLGICKVQAQLKEKRDEIRKCSQKISKDIEEIKKAGEKDKKSASKAGMIGRPRKVDTLLLNSKQEEEGFARQHHSSNEPEFQFTVLSSGVFYPPGCSAFDIAYCRANDSVYVYGGISCTTELSQGLTQYFYQLDSAGWKQIKPVSIYTPMPRYGHTLTGTHDSLLLFGGVSEYKEKMKDRCFYADVWQFNINKNNWKMLEFTGQHITNRKSHAACMYGKFYIVYGGINDSEEVIGEISWVNIEDKRGRWRSRKMEGRFNHRIAIAQAYNGRDYLVVFGGRNCQSQLVGDLLLYPVCINEGELQIKEPIKAAPELPACEQPLLDPIDAGLLIMGGIDSNNQPLSQCWFFNLNRMAVERIDNNIDWGELRGARATAQGKGGVYIMAGSSKKYKAIKVGLRCNDQFHID